MLNWDNFKKLAGSEDVNFEKLCRSIVKGRYGSLGLFKERKNQPGVEFYVQLHRDSSELGNINDQIGWQCKWFTPNSNGNLKSVSRDKIVDSLNKTLTHVPNLTHWILWIPFTLTKTDQDWFYSLQGSYSFRLILWNENDLDRTLQGSTLELRHSYFGEWVLTSEILQQEHERSISSIKERWIPQVHQKLEEELEIRKLLGEENAWKGFQEAKTSLSITVERINALIGQHTYEEWETTLNQLLERCSIFNEFTEFFNKPIKSEDTPTISSMLEQLNEFSWVELHILARQMRKRNLPMAIEITNCLAYMSDIRLLLEDTLDCLTQSFIAIMANAGGGKTHMAIEITSPQANRPAGIFLHGRYLCKGSTLDSLAQKITLHGQPVPSFQALLAAVDAAAYRADCRLPIVIDGLNEAEDPRNWKPLLAEVMTLLKHYPNVLLVCTLRTGEHDVNELWGHREVRGNRESFAKMALPESCKYLESEGFGRLTIQAIRNYFDYFKIDTDLTQVPEDFFNHPLNLRIFCESKNRAREQQVRVEHFPISMNNLFQDQIDYAAERIADANTNPSYTVDDVKKAIYELGIMLWDSNQRHINEAAFLGRLRQTGRSWDANLVNLFAQEGIIFRDPGGIPGEYEITPTYDRLGGYIIADALLKKHLSDNEFVWVSNTEFSNKLFGKQTSTHVLAQDIMTALVALLPQVKQTQLWMKVPQEYKNIVLEESTLIDAQQICDETINAYKSYLINGNISAETVGNLKRIKGSSEHPLNAVFLDSVLKELSLAERDLRWTELLRVPHRFTGYNENHHVEELHHMWGRWKERDIRTEGDRLRAIWYSWYLTSTSIALRDAATKALSCYGQQAPQQLFEITISSLSVNDPYVPERLLAASYGVLLVHLCMFSEIPTGAESMAKQLYHLMFSDSALYSTTHSMTREYASKFIKLICDNFPDQIISENEIQNISHPFPAMPRKEWHKIAKSTKIQGHSPFHMDFENYTVGRLVSGRRNYDYNNESYRDVMAKIRWRVVDLGWDGNQFSKIDGDIASLDYQNQRFRRSKTERYGKKYSWIAYYEMAGQLQDEELLEHSNSRFAVDIDPTFPIPEVSILKDRSFYLDNVEMDNNTWITLSDSPEIDLFASQYTPDNEADDWIAISGYVVEESKRLDRNFYMSQKSVVMNKDNVGKLLSHNASTFNKSCGFDIEQFREIYAGELYLDEALQANKEVELQFEIGSEVKTIEIPEVLFEEDESGFKMATGNITMRNITEPVYETIMANSVCAEYNWSYDNDEFARTGSTIITPHLFKKLNLIFNPISFEYFDSNGQLVAKEVSFKEPISKNLSRFFYIRKSVLNQYLENNRLILVSYIRGERRLARIEHFDSTNGSEIKFSEFSFFKTH